MFMAILDSQFMSLASSEFEAEHLGFFELIVHIIGEKVREKKIQVYFLFFKHLNLLFPTAQSCTDSFKCGNFE